MMPAYRSMDSYPYQRSQIPFPHCYHHGTEAVPPQLRGDPSKSPFSYEQFWPYGGSYGHPMLPNTSFCCGHNNFPGYYSYYRPSHPQAPVPPPMYYSGGCPAACGEPFFAPYTPQQHYTMELPRYEYDRSMPREHHCCGCPNHQCNQKEGKSVKIEEQEPDVEKKVNDDALVPLQLRNYPYPFVWIPPEYTSNRQLKNPTTAEAGEQDKISHERKPQGTGNGNSNADAQPALEPRVWNGWLPFGFDMKGAPNMVHDGDGRRSLSRGADNNGRECEDGRMNQKHQNEPKRSEFPFPIVWLPYYNKPEEDGRTNKQDSDSTPKRVEEVPRTLKSVPVKSHVDEDVANRTRSNEAESTNIGDSDAVKKVTNERIIPVKQVESDQGKIYSEGSNKREMNVPVNQMEENVTRKDSHTSGKRPSASPPKASKLPPVCLRVDPLPRKKNGNGSSRSPSPPASKQHSQAAAGETSKTPSCGVHDKVQPNSNLEKVDPKERTIQVSQNKTSENKGAECGDAHQSQIDLNMPSGVPTETRESYTDGEKSMTQDKKEEKGAESMMEEATESNEVKGLSTSVDEGQKEGRVLSDADAAVLIQAAYRGYHVRKWEPLKKLKQIAEVSKEVIDVRGRVQSLEDSSDLQNDDKRKIAIGENIMRLLLKLDTIQGLHPSLREIRKSLVKELVTLQERLDSIMANKPQQQIEEPVVQEPVEVTPLNMENGKYQQEQCEEEVAKSGGSFEGIKDGNHDTLEKCQDHFSMKDGTNNVPPADGESESQSPIDPAPIEGIEPKALPNGLVNLNQDISSVVTVDAVSSTNDPSDTEKVVVEHESEVNDIPIDVNKLDTSAWKELPVGVIDEDIIDINSGKDENVKEEDQSAEFTTTMMDGSFSSMVDVPACDGLDSGNQAMMELPVGVLDEDTAKFEVEKHDETATCEEVNDIPIDVDKLDTSSREELPVGVIDEDIIDISSEKDEKGTEEVESAECTTVIDGSFSAMVDDSASDGLDSENQAMLELPVGVLDEDTEKFEVEKHYETETCKEVLLAGEKYNADERARSSTDDTLEETQIKQPLVEVEDEIELQNEDKFKGDAALDIEFGNDTKFPALAAQVNGHDLRNEDVCLEAKGVHNILAEPVELVLVDDLQKEKDPEMRLALHEMQVDGPDMVVEKTIGVDDGETETLAKETEVYAAAPALKEVPIAENVGGLNGDMKLLEENEKLRKLMKELLEAGNEQLTVITELTGRVKDLEKKLARNKRKRVKTRRGRLATSKMS